MTCIQTWAGVQKPSLHYDERCLAVYSRSKSVLPNYCSKWRHEMQLVNKGGGLLFVIRFHFMTAWGTKSLILVTYDGFAWGGGESPKSLTQSWKKAREMLGRHECCCTYPSFRLGRWGRRIPPLSRGKSLPSTWSKAVPSAVCHGGTTLYTFLEKKRHKDKSSN